MKKFLFTKAKASLVFLVVLLMASQGMSGQNSPLQIIKESNQKILDIFSKNHKITKDAEDLIFKVIDGVTDFPALSRSVIEQFCRKLSKTECEQFDRVFQRLLRISSIKKLGRYRADRFDYQGEEINNNKAVVKTIAHYKEERIQLNYQLEKQANTWKIVNYIVDDVDTIRNYKKQFVRLFARSAFNKIIERLQKKIRSYGQESKN